MPDIATQMETTVGMPPYEKLLTKDSRIWARFRNRFRQRFHARRGKAIDPETLLNETGARDMIINKTPCKSNEVVPQNLAPMTVVKGDPFVVKDAPAADTTDEGFKNFEVADKAVIESLTHVVIEADINHSAIHSARPKTVKEFMEAFGIVGGGITDDGLPTVSV